MARGAMLTAAVVFLTLGAMRAPVDAATSLLLPQSAAFAVLGHSCGGIQEQALATGFDAASGYPTGDVYLQTRCGGSGRGGGYHTTTYSRWVEATWDYTGTLVSFTVLAAAPSGLDPAFSAVDGYGNRLYNHLNAVNVLPESCSVGNTTYCSYRAYLELAATFTPPPRVTGVSVASGPAAGGTSLIITGTGFTGATAVKFGGTDATSFSVTGDASITAVSPLAAAGIVDITVTTAGGTSAPVPEDQFTFIPTPSVSGLSPNSGPLNGGTLVTITGTGFIDVVAVNFGETPVGFSVDDPSTITATSPPGEDLDAVRVTVVTVGGTSANSVADEFTYTPAVPVPFCGDGTVDPGEDCDDGAANGQPGDCCTATCAFQPAGTACTDDGSLCTDDVCDAAGACTHIVAPTLACTPPDVAMGARLRVRALPAGRSQAQFQWGQGPAVPLADFGDPSGADVLELCIYEPTGPDTYALVIGASPSASGGGAWAGNAIGWRFRSRTGAPDGVTSVVLTAATDPLKAKVQIKAPSSAALAPLPLLPAVIAQLKSSTGSCWGAAFSTPMVNTAAEFKARSD